MLKSSPAVELTESETEYVVSCIKHIFDAHVVLQFTIKNTLPDTVLADVSVVATPAEDDDGNAVLEEEFIIPAEKLLTDVPGTVYVAFKKVDPEQKLVASSFTNVLKFTSKEIDPTTNEEEEGGYEDEYQVEDLELSGSDYVLPAYAGSFDNVWEQSAGEDEASETLQLGGVKSIAGTSPHPVPDLFYLLTPLAEAVETLPKTLSLQPLEGTDVALNTSTHTLKLYGKTITGGKVAALVRMAYSGKTGVTMKIEARSEEPNVATLVVASVA